MRKALLLFSLLLIISPLGAQEEPKAPKESVIWQEDPVCQFVFFAVLEGLYRDGVQDEIVDLVIGKAGADDTGVKRCFVFQCELCHATYEAFCLYRQRQQFANSSGKTTFGPGVDPKILQDLRSVAPPTRIYAMGRLIRPWIQQRIQNHRLTREEQIALHDRITEYATEGKVLLDQLRSSDDLYVNWNFYGSCQACEAAEDIASNLPVKKDEE